ncbi:sigma-70 family RNA polymerase sigma factor [bacterium]|nr:sigma-70 family RNA polymerase sigma factor [bacterium]
MPATPETRPSLILRLRDPQDEQAWAEFLELYQPLIERLGRRKGLQDADVRELVQDVLVSVAGAVERWEPSPDRGSFCGWLATIIRNLTINLLKREARHPRGSGDSDFQQLLEQQPDPHCGTTALFDLEYRRQLFHWAAERICHEFQPSTWSAFWTTCVEGQPVDAAASGLEMSRGAVYVARSRVMARLREVIERRQRE